MFIADFNLNYFKFDILYFIKFLILQIYKKIIKLLVKFMKNVNLKEN